MEAILLTEDKLLSNIIRLLVKKNLVNRNLNSPEAYQKLPFPKKEIEHQTLYRITAKI